MLCSRMVGPLYPTRVVTPTPSWMLAYDTTYCMARTIHVLYLVAGVTWMIKGYVRRTGATTCVALIINSLLG